jgi:hypothetical protein
LRSCQKIFRKFVERSSILNLGCGQGGNHKKDVLGLGWMPGKVCEISNIETHNAWTRMASMKKDMLRNGQLLSLVPQKSILIQLIKI